MRIVLSLGALVVAAWMLARLTGPGASSVDGSVRIWRRMLLVLLAGFLGAGGGVGVVWVTWVGVGRPDHSGWAYAGLVGLAVGSGMGVGGVWWWLVRRAQV